MTVEHMAMAEARAQAEFYVQANYDHSFRDGSGESGGPHSLDVIPPYEVTERWEGAVEEVMYGYFVATLTNLANETSTTSEIPLGKVSPSDRELVQPGALFFWTLGQYVAENLDSTNYSAIRFRRGVTPSGPSTSSESARESWFNAPL